MTSIDAIRDQLVDARDRETAGLAERVGLGRVQIGAGDELERVERARILHVCAADHAAANDPDFHATSPSMVMTAASERRASSSSDAHGLVLLHDQPVHAGARRRGDDALVAHRAVADRAVRVLAAHAEVLDVDERAAAEQRDRIDAGVPRPAGVQLEEDLAPAAARESPARPRRRGCGTRARGPASATAVAATARRASVDVSSSAGSTQLTTRRFQPSAVRPPRRARRARVSIASSRACRLQATSPSSSSQRGDLLRLVAVQVEQLDALVAERRDLAQRRLEVVGRGLAHRVQLQRDAAHAGRLT